MTGMPAMKVPARRGSPVEPAMRSTHMGKSAMRRRAGGVRPVPGRIARGTAMRTMRCRTGRRGRMMMVVMVVIRPAIPPAIVKVGIEKGACSKGEAEEKPVRVEGRRITGIHRRTVDVGITVDVDMLRI